MAYAEGTTVSPERSQNEAECGSCYAEFSLAPQPADDYESCCDGTAYAHLPEEF